MSVARQDESVFVSAGSTLDGRIRKLERANRIVVGACVLIASAWLAHEAWKVATYSNAAVLQMGEFCKVADPWSSGGGFGPTGCYLWSREHDAAPLAAGADEFPDKVAVDVGTIVEVHVDGGERAAEKIGPVEVDARLVAVRYVTGPYSGRGGFVERYKLSRMGRLLRD